MVSGVFYFGQKMNGTIFLVLDQNMTKKFEVMNLTPQLMRRNSRNP